LPKFWGLTVTITWIGRSSGCLGATAAGGIARDLDNRIALPAGRAKEENKPCQEEKAVKEQAGGWEEARAAGVSEEGVVQGRWLAPQLLASARPAAPRRPTSAAFPAFR